MPSLLPQLCAPGALWRTAAANVRTSGATKRCRRSWIRGAAATAIVVAALRTFSFDFEHGSALERSELQLGEAGAAFTLASGLSRSPAAQITAGPGAEAGHESSRIVLHATAAKTKSKAPRTGSKYRGPVSPRLRAFLESKEYKDVVSLLTKLQNAGLLQDFVKKLEDYIASLNMFELAVQEREQGGRGITKTIRADWGKVWPPTMEGDRMAAFEICASVFARLDRSKLLEMVMQSIFPDLGKGDDAMRESKSQQELMEMTTEERQKEILRRMGSSDIVNQYVALSADDDDVKAISKTMTPAIARAVLTFEAKLRAQTEQAGQNLDKVVAGAIAVVILIALVATGTVKIPDVTWGGVKL
eukprot:TRINITY_DN84010_c0_g1_i1.p1 TRINITY_DN84010_c0_g1~~TRINITY_DN84010_c0_g1_i1.p1  ORF type:complete len:359 (+),score=92.05 TRINITY_DN84010_c0_g1_i1:82-1158(+)